jgi:hypothetical protein
MNPLEKIELLTIKYKKELPQKISLIKKNFEVSIEKGFTDEEFKSFYRSIHNIVGGAATFEMIDISNAAKLIEREIYPFYKNKTTPSIKELEKVKELILRLDILSNNIEQDSI